MFATSNMVYFCFRFWNKYKSHALVAIKGHSHKRIPVYEIPHEILFNIFHFETFLFHEIINLYGRRLRSKVRMIYLMSGISRDKGFILVDKNHMFLVAYCDC